MIDVGTAFVILETLGSGDDPIWFGRPRKETTLHDIWSAFDNEDSTKIRIRYYGAKGYTNGTVASMLRSRLRDAFKDAS